MDQRLPQLATHGFDIRVAAFAENISILRLALLGFTRLANMSYQDIEDIRLAVGEGCLHCLSRIPPYEQDPGQMNLTGWIEDNQVVVEISADYAARLPSYDGNGWERITFEEHFPIAMLELLVDDVRLFERHDGTRMIRLTKDCLPDRCEVN